MAPQAPEGFFFKDGPMSMSAGAHEWLFLCYHRETALQLKKGQFWPKVEDDILKTLAGVIRAVGSISIIVIWPVGRITTVLLGLNVPFNRPTGHLTSSLSSRAQRTYANPDRNHNANTTNPTNLL